MADGSQGQPLRSTSSAPRGLCGLLHKPLPLLRQPSLLGAVSLFADVEMRCRDSKLCFAGGHS